MVNFLMSDFRTEISTEKHEKIFGYTMIKPYLHFNQITDKYRHTNVISYKEAFFDEISKTLCIVMEFADGGDLYLKI
jgi:hypothetical protein